jgi:hypothetical protein
MHRVRELIRLITVAVCAAGMCMPAMGFAQSADFVWSQTYLPTNKNMGGYLSKIARNTTDGSIYVADRSHDQVTNKNSIDLIKYSAAGSQAWAASFGNYDNSIVVSGLVVDGSGNVYLTANISDVDVTMKVNSSGSAVWSSEFHNVSGGGSAQSDSNMISLDSEGNVYIIANCVSGGGYALVKYDSDGNQQWSGTQGSNCSVASAIVVDGNDDVHVTGYNLGSQIRVVTAAYDSDGNRLWVQTYNDGNSGQAASVQADSSGNTYVVGGTYSAQGFAGYEKFLVIKYNSSGTQQWVRTHGSSTNCAEGYSSRLTSAGDLYVLGVDDCGGPKAHSSILLKYDTSGNLAWASQSYGYSNSYMGSALAIDSGGYIYIGGPASGSNYDYVLAAYNGSGTQVWTAAYVTAGNDILRSIVTDDSGNVYAAGVTCTVGTNICSELTTKYAEPDLTPPVVTGAPNSSANANGWYNHDVAITWTAVDSDSSASGVSPVTADSEGYHVTYTSDWSCNPSSVCATGSLQLSIDKTAPTVSSGSMAGTLFLLSSLLPNTTTAQATAGDATSGIVAGESYIDTDPGQGNGAVMSYGSGTISSTVTIPRNLSIGQHKLYMRARDAAGNWSTPLYVTFTTIL